MNYAEIKEADVANGPGVRLSLFVSGCTHYCKGCFNAVAWDFDYGEPFTEAVEEQMLKTVGASYYTGMTLLGGEPMEPDNQRALVGFVRRFKAMYPQKTLWCFTGYLLDEDLLEGGRAHTEVTDELLGYIDVLVDGEFVEEKKDITLLYKGSSNQRTIDVQKSLEKREIVYWEPGDVSISATAKL